MSDGASILLTISGTVVGAALGAVATWYVDHRSRLKSSAGLDAALRPIAEDAQKLLQAFKAFGAIMEEHKLGEFSRDEAGNITGIVLTGTGHIRLSGLRVSGTGTCTPPPQYDRQHEQPPPPESEGDHA